MKTTGIFTVHKYEIKFKRYNEPIYIIPFGDIHRSAPHCDVERWQEFLDWAKKKERCYFLGMGDYDDLASTSEREILHNDRLHDSTKSSLEKFYDSQTRILAKEISFMKNRIIGFIEGNHYSRFQDGTTSTQRLCQYVNGAYLGVTSFIILTLRYNDSTAHNVVLWAHHGLGGGRTAGASINKVEQMERVAEADIYLMGHDHKKSVAINNKFHLDDVSKNPQMKIRKILLARTGTFLRGYVRNNPSYIADAGGAPTDLGTIKIELTPRRKREGSGKHTIEDRYVDIHASL